MICHTFLIIPILFKKFLLRLSYYDLSLFSHYSSKILLFSDYVSMIYHSFSPLSFYIFSLFFSHYSSYNLSHLSLFFSDYPSIIYCFSLIIPLITLSIYYLSLFSHYPSLSIALFSLSLYYT